MIDPRAARQQIDHRLERLKVQSFADLTKLPALTIDDIRFGAEQWAVTTYRVLEKDGLRIVVQIGPPQTKFLLLHVQADGFRMKQDGTLTALGESELDEYS